MSLLSVLDEGNERIWKLIVSLALQPLEMKLCLHECSACLKYDLFGGLLTQMSAWTVERRATLGYNRPLLYVNVKQDPVNF